MSDNEYEYKPTMLPIPKQVPSRAEIEQYCEKHASVIPVRAQVNGEWQVVYLSDLPRDQWEDWIQRWFLRCILPTRTVKDNADPR